MNWGGSFEFSAGGGVECFEKWEREFCVETRGCTLIYVSVDKLSMMCFIY